MTEERHKPWRDREILTKLYHGKQLSQRQIAEKLGVSQGAIARCMEENNIETRDAHTAHAKSMLSKPACFGTIDRGHEIWKTQFSGNYYQVYVHRLLAVAKYGIETVKGNHVHHKNGVKWDNRPGNIEVLSNSEHQSKHPRPRGEDGRFLNSNKPDALVTDGGEKRRSCPACDSLDVCPRARLGGYRCGDCSWTGGVTAWREPTHDGLGRNGLAGVLEGLDADDVGGGD